MSFDLLPWMDYVTLAIAALGAGLGIINTWHGLNQRRMKLMVVPKVAYLPSHGSEEMGCINVTNLSAFPVTIREVGFTIDGDPRKKARAAIPQPIVMDGDPWPRRLEARTSVSLFFDWTNLKHGIKKAYALTDCGNVAYGDSPALRNKKRQLFR